MPIAFDSFTALLNHGFDTVIDVRSPAEFAEDHIPGAINLPALSNAQRAQVGTIYKQVSPFDGRKVGAAMVAHNVADHIAGPLSAKDGAWRPLVYCWRGGQRSGSFAMILSQIGWRAQTIQGGYQSFRKLVHATLYDQEIPHKFILLDGNTGTAKTAILAQLKTQGVQVIDLEGLAGHRGSLLGATPAGQPSQKAFETNLAMALTALDPARPVLIEAESSKIGRIVIPPQVWRPMCAAPRIMIAAPLSARAEFLTQAYADIIADPETFRTQLNPLRTYRSHALVDHWNTLLDNKDFNTLAASLMQDHYDPAYAKSRGQHDHIELATLTTDRLDPAGIAQIADQIMAHLPA